MLVSHSVDVHGQDIHGAELLETGPGAKVHIEVVLKEGLAFAKIRVNLPRGDRLFLGQFSAPDVPCGRCRRKEWETKRLTPKTFCEFIRAAVEELAQDGKVLSLEAIKASTLEKIRGAYDFRPNHPKQPV